MCYSVGRLGHYLPSVPQGLMLYSRWLPTSVRIQKGKPFSQVAFDGYLCTAVRIVKVDLPWIGQNEDLCVVCLVLFVLIYFAFSLGKQPDTNIAYLRKINCLGDSLIHLCMVDVGHTQFNHPCVQELRLCPPPIKSCFNKQQTIF